jgi:hypothetical protein
MAKALFNDDMDVANNTNADKFASLVAYHYNRMVDSK